MELLSPLLNLGPKAPPQAASDLKQAAEAFEGAFLQILLKSMRDTIPDGGLFNRQQMEAYEEMQDRELADSLASRGALGIADAIVRQLGGGDEQAPASARPVTSLAAPTVTAAPRAQKTVSQESFISELWPAARRVGSELKVSAAVLVAQAALETGWGQHVPNRADGSSSNNLFGIKAGAGWSGQKVWNQTTEFLGGKLRQVTAGFRAYESMAESMADYSRLISQSPRYQAALSAGSDHEYLQSIQAAGYATDPLYAQKIGAILDDPAFQRQTARIESALTQNEVP